MKKTIIILIVLLFPTLTHAGDLKPFTTDGCSIFPDGKLQQQSLWANCCIRHDLAYWKGGTDKERLKADIELEACVAKVGEKEIAGIMLAGVRVGGSPYSIMSYRWGYGWPMFRGYKSLTHAEKKEVKDKLDLFRIMVNSLSKELN